MLRHLTIKSPWPKIASLRIWNGSATENEALSKVRIFFDTATPHGFNVRISDKDGFFLSPQLF
jgi:hypothetical protein